MWLDKLKQMKTKCGMTTKDISEKSGIPEPTLEKLFAGATKDPKLKTMQQLVHFFGYTLDDLDDGPLSSKGLNNDNVLSPGERETIKKYRFLDPDGQEAVDVILDVEYRRCTKSVSAGPTPEPEDTVYFICPGFLVPMSAGTGQPAGNDYPENYRLVKEPPRGTSYIAPIDGNSMEPTYQDGDKLFIHACTEIRRGQIGVFFMDGKQWVKELGDGVLISHNPEYEPRRMTEDIVCQGLVLGVCDDSYLE